MSDYFSIPYFSVASDYFALGFLAIMFKEVSSWARRIERNHSRRARCSA
jgi:hypothetical protein